MFDLNTAGTYNIRLECQVTTVSSSCDNNNVNLGNTPYYRFTVCGNQVGVTGSVDSPYEQIASNTGLTSSNGAALTDWVTTYTNGDKNEYFSATKTTYIMNNVCGITLQEITDSTGVVLTDFTLESNKVWPNTPTDANKYIVPPAIKTDYTYYIKSTIKGGHTILKGPYTYTVKC